MPRGEKSQNVFSFNRGKNTPPGCIEISDCRVSDKNFCRVKFFPTVVVCLKRVPFSLPHFLRFASLSHKAIVFLFTGSQILVAEVFSKFMNKSMCNIMVHLKLRVWKISLVFFRNVLESFLSHDYHKCAAGKIRGLFSVRK